MNSTTGHHRFCAHCGFELSDNLEHVALRDGLRQIVRVNHEPRPDWATITAGAL